MTSRIRGETWTRSLYDFLQGGIPILRPQLAGDVPEQLEFTTARNLQMCFPDATIRSGAFSITEKSGGGIRVGFNPEGSGTDGRTTGIRYLVLMDGEVSDPPFPATLGDDATVTLLNWRIDHDTGKERKAACHESGTFSQSTSIEISRNPPAP